MSTQERPGDLGPVRRDTYHEVKARLHRFIEQLAADGERRLPGEDQLSARLGVSRPTIRAALLSLQKEGLLQRSHGKGTFIHRHAVRIRTNISADRPFLDIIADLGYQPSTSTCGRSVQLLPTDIADKLDRKPGVEALILERQWLAGSTPAVYAIDHIPVELVADLDAPGEESVFAFLEQHAGRIVQYSVADLIPVVAEADVASRLQLDVGDPLLLLHHTHIDDKDEPVAVTRAFVSPGLMQFSVVRTYRDI